MGDSYFEIQQMGHGLTFKAIINSGSYYAFFIKACQLLSWMKIFVHYKDAE